MISYGADPLLTNHTGHTPLYYMAERERHDSVVALCEGITEKLQKRDPNALLALSEAIFAACGNVQGIAILECLLQTAIKTGAVEAGVIDKVWEPINGSTNIFTFDKTALGRAYYFGFPNLVALMLCAGVGEQTIKLAYERKFEEKDHRKPGRKICAELLKNALQNKKRPIFDIMGCDSRLHDSRITLSRAMEKIIPYT